MSPAVKVLCEVQPPKDLLTEATGLFASLCLLKGSVKAKKRGAFVIEAERWTIETLRRLLEPAGIKFTINE